jgi:hypothetical protein
MACSFVLPFFKGILGFDIPVTFAPGVFLTALYGGLFVGAVGAAASSLEEVT